RAFRGLRARGDDRVLGRHRRGVRRHRREPAPRRARQGADRAGPRADALRRRLLRRRLLVRRARPSPARRKEDLMRISAVRRLEQEAAEDIFFGQVVMIWARWFLIAGGTIFFLWTAQKSTEVALGVLPIVALMALNFYLHGRYLLERPSNVLQITAASTIDVALVSAIVVVWQSTSPPGLTGRASPFYVLYYRFLLASGFVMPRRLTLIFNACTAGVYAAICLPAVTSITNAKVLVLRLATLAAMGGIETFYWRIQRSRRHDGLEAVS